MKVVDIGGTGLITDAAPYGARVRTGGPPRGASAMVAEFDAVAGWTADAVPSRRPHLPRPLSRTA